MTILYIDSIISSTTIEIVLVEPQFYLRLPSSRWHKMLSEKTVLSGVLAFFQNLRKIRYVQYVISIVTIS
jgi:hypothetical protein